MNDKEAKIRLQPGGDVEANDQDVNPDLIRSNLQQVLVSTEFSNSPRLKKFLTYVVEQSLTGDAASLKAYSIAVEALGKGAEFDPTDPYVRNVARDVRRALAVLYGRQDVDLDLRIDIPKGTYKPVFRQRSEFERQETKSIYHGSGKTKLYTGTAEAAPQASLTASHNLPESPTIAHDIFLRPTIAVIPLRFHSGSAEYEVIGEIIAANIITCLSISSDLEIISRLSTTKFRSVSSDSDHIRDSLKPNYILAGSYIVNDKGVRLNFELSDASTMHVLWANSMETSIADVLAGNDGLAEEISITIAMAIPKQEFRLSQINSLESLELHTLLISAIELMHRASPNDFARSKQMLDLLLRKCPKHSLPHTYIGHWHILAVNRSAGWSADLTKEKEAAIRACEMALELDPNDSLAHTIRGVTAINFERDPDSGERHYDRALLLDPSNAIARGYRAALHGFKEEGHLALEDARCSLRLSPVDPLQYLFEAFYAAAAMAAGDYILAEEHALKSYNLNSNHTSNIRALIAILIELGKTEEAKKFAAKLMELDPDFTTASYRTKGANSIYKIGEKIAIALERAGIPKS